MNLNLIGMVFISGILSTGFYLSVYDKGDSIKTEIQTATQNLKNTEQNLQKKKIELEETVAFDDSVKRLGKEIDVFLSYIPTQLTTRDLFEDITQLAQLSSVDIVRMRNSTQNSTKNSLYDSIAVSLALEGEYAQVMTFLSKLTSLDKIITVTNVNIQPIRGNLQSARIKADMNLMGYRYLGSSNAKEEKKI